jgi:outer membrane protein OmpA-like peptidoglycan-associated protein
MMAGAAGWAQQSQKPAVTTDLAVTFAVERSQVLPDQCCFWFKGGGADAAVTFWKGFGLAAALNGDHAGNVTPGVDINKLTYLGGPRYTWTSEASGTSDRRWQLFGQGLFGETHGFDGVYPALPAATSSASAFALQAGGGLNLLLTKHFGLRLLEADYVRTELPNSTTDKQNDLRLSFGLTYHLGAEAAPTPVTLACSASPAVIFPGDPVAVTATAGNLNPKLNAIYLWSGAGVTGTGATATVATGSLAAGSYTVKCGVKQGKPGKEGLKPGESADATASFTVKAFEPPSISCSANPAAIQMGGSSTVTAAGMSPQNRPLSYSYTATAGAVAGSGATAEFNSAGAAAGAVNIACNVSDDKGQTATANTTVTILAPVVAAPSPEIKKLEARLALHSIFFPTDQPKIAKPEGGLVSSQEATLTALAADFKRYQEFKPEAHLILSGHADARGSSEYNKLLSERRVARTKQFLAEQGVAEASIETRGLGSEHNLSAAEVKALLEQNPDLSAAEREKLLGDLTVIVWAQNRRVDVTLSTTGEQSVRQFPFNASDSLTLLDKKNPAAGKKAAAPAAKPAIKASKPAAKAGK